MCCPQTDVYITGNQKGRGEKKEKKKKAKKEKEEKEKANRKAQDL